MANGDVKLRLSNKQFKKLAAMVLGLRYEDIKRINEVKIVRKRK